MHSRHEQPHTVASRDGTRIGVWESGAGPPLVLIHGAAADHRRWAPIVPALAEHFRVLAIDRRGRGASDDADTYAIEREYDDVAAVLEWAGPEANVLGHSYGGICALEAALLTTAIGKLVVYEPPMGFLVSPPEVVDRLQALCDAGEREELVAFFMREVAGVPDHQVEVMRALPAWGARLDVAHTIPREERASREYRFDAERLRGVDVPTLVLQGGDSADPFKAAAQALHDALPRCRIAMLPGQRHTAMDTAPDLFLAEVLGFLQAPSNDH
ncbi:MAG TPA: alpha/beta hydrolase [Solirubrobacteraceae bacterium]|nr:alpha/beta hydrolase [Solirubrobacteraceae bacterium]